MSSAPTWKYQPLADVAELITGPFGSSLKKHEYVTGGIPVINPMHIENGRITPSTTMTVSSQTASRLGTFRMRAGDVVIGRRGEMGRCAVVPEASEGWVCGTGSLIVRPNSQVHPPYLQRFLSSPSVVSLLEGASVGSTMVNLNQRILRSIEIPMPPISVQKRIADKLDQLLATVDTCKARLDAIPNILKRFRQSVLAAAVSGALTEEWRSRTALPSVGEELEGIRTARICWAKAHSEHNEAGRALKISLDRPPRIQATDELPDGWALAELQDVLHLIVDCHNKTAPYANEGIPLIRTSNRRDGKLVWEKMRFVNEATYGFWSRRCPPESGDIIYTREAPMGEAIIIPEGLRVCLGQRTMLFRPNHQFTNVDYLLLALMDVGFKKRAEQSAVGSGVKHLRVGDVGTLKIALPPHAEQVQIAHVAGALLGMADQLEVSLQAVSARVEKMSTSLLVRAFRGELSRTEHSSTRAIKSKRVA